MISKWFDRNSSPAWSRDSGDQGTVRLGHNVILINELRDLKVATPRGFVLTEQTFEFELSVLGLRSTHSGLPRRLTTVRFVAY